MRFWSLQKNRKHRKARSSEDSSRFLLWFMNEMIMRTSEMIADDSWLWGKKEAFVNERAAEKERQHSSHLFLNDHAEFLW